MKNNPSKETNEFPNLPTNIGLVKLTDERLQEIFSEALKKYLPSVRPPKDDIVNFQIRLTRAKKPAVGARIRCYKLKEEPTRRKTRLCYPNGVAFLSIEKSLINKDLCIEALFKDGKTVTFNGFKIPMDRVRSYHGEEDTVLEVAALNSPFIIPRKQPKVSTKPLVVSLSGSIKQLREAIPFFKDLDCINIKTVYVKDKKVKEKLLLNIKVLPLDEKIGEMLKGTNVLIDFSDDKIIGDLYTKIIKGDSQNGTIIIMGASQFLGRFDKLLSIFEKTQKRFKK